jgi:hypothetical protein
MIWGVEYLLEEMEKTAVRTFGIGRITTIEKQATKLMQEIGGSTKLQFTVKAYFFVHG